MDIIEHTETMDYKIPTGALGVFYTNVGDGLKKYIIQHGCCCTAPISG